MKLARFHGSAPVGIITNDAIDTKASNFEGLRDLKGGHRSVWCDRVAKR